MSLGTTLNSNPETLAHPDQFGRRHIGPNVIETAAMLQLIGHDSLDALADAAVPKGIRLTQSLELPKAKSEFDALRELKSIASQNQVFRSFIGMGYYDTITPPGTPNTRRIRPRFPRDVSKRC